MTPLQSLVSKGTRLTRKQRAIEEAKIKEADALAKLDSEHQRYLKLLSQSKVRRCRATSSSEPGPPHSGSLSFAWWQDKGDSDASDGESSDDGFFDDPDSTARPNPLLSRAQDSSDDHEPSAGEAAVAADRWFSQPMFQDVEEEALASAALEQRRAGMFDGDSDDSDDSDDSGSDGAGAATGRGNARKARKPAVELEELPLTDRQKRKEKHRKQRAKCVGWLVLWARGRSRAVTSRMLCGRVCVGVSREAAREARKRRRDEDFEVVRGNNVQEANVDDDLEDDEDLTPQQKKDRQAKRDLIRAGMGKAIAQLTGKEAGNFEVVAAPPSDEEASGSDSDDPRNDAYDSDTHAELLALGKKMRRHTTAKALMDASYNRYSFNDDYLPRWFTTDEKRHFRPQLPITRAEVEKIKSNFRDIAARPVHKVAEARARKRRRLLQNLAKAKQQAQQIVKSEDMGALSKARAIEKAFKRAELKKQSTTYVVYRNGHQIGSKGGGKGSRTKLVDPRLKSDTLALKKAQKRAQGKGKKARKGKSRNGRRKR